MKTYMELSAKNAAIQSALQQAFADGRGEYLTGLATLTYLAATFYDETMEVSETDMVGDIYDEVMKAGNLPADYDALVVMYDKMFEHEIVFQHSFENLAKTVGSLDESVLLEQMNQLKELQNAEDSALGELKKML